MEPGREVKFTSLATNDCVDDCDGEERVRRSFLSGFTTALAPFLTAFFNEAVLRDSDETEDFVDGVDEGWEEGG